MNPNLKFIFRCLSIFSLILILPFPTEFYFFSRVIVFLGAIYTAIKIKNLPSSKGESTFFILCAIAFIFNPIIMVFLYSKALWAVLNILAAYTFFKAASLLDDIQMETLSTQTKNTNKSVNTQVVKIQDENQKKENKELQKKSLKDNSRDESIENEITAEYIENFRALTEEWHMGYQVHGIKRGDDGKSELIPSFRLLPEDTQKKIDVLKKTHPDLFKELFESFSTRVNEARTKRKAEKNPTRLDIALRYFQFCIQMHIERGGKPEFLFMVGVRKYQMDKFKDIDISFWQYTRIEAEANSFVKYHLNQNQRDELIRVSRLLVISTDPKLEEIRGYLDKII